MGDIKVEIDQACYLFYDGEVFIGHNVNDSRFAIPALGINVDFDEITILGAISIPEDIKAMAPYHKIECPSCGGKPKVFPNNPALYYLVCRECNGTGFITKLKGEK